MKKFLLVDQGMPFNLETPYTEPIGGSETSLLLLSKGLADSGNSVIILSNTNKDVPQRDYNRLLHNVNALPSILQESDIIIFNRCIIPEVLNTNKRIFYYNHDAYDQTHIIWWMTNKDLLKRIEKILCVSEWQKETFIKYIGVPKEKLHVIGNGLDIDLYSGYVERKLNKLIFASIPYKGIDILPNLFNDICIQSKRDDLELHVYSSMSLYGQDANDKEYEKSFSELQRIKGVFLHKPISMRELAFEFLTSSLYIHPNTYHETFGMNLTQAQCGGCIPITTNNGAVNEVIRNGETGFITKGKTIWNNECYKEYVNLVCDCLNKDLYKNRLKAQLFSKQFSYNIIAKKLLEII